MGNLIKINKLIVQGEEYQRTFVFTNGLNIISGDAYTGKSLVLKCINYCLGESDTIPANVQRELFTYCDRVFLELAINDNTFTLLRDLKTQPNHIHAFFCDFNEIGSYIPKFIAVSDFPKFMFELLEIPELYRIKNKAHDTLKTTEAISFRDIMRFVFIPQDDLGTRNFLKNGNVFVRPKNKSAFQLILNLITPDYDSIAQQIVENTNRIQQINKEISGLNQYLIERSADNKVEKDLELIKVRHSTNELQNKKRALLQQVHEEKQKLNSLYESVQEKTKSIYKEVRFNEDLIRDANFSLLNKKSLHEDYKKEIQELIATKEAMYKVHLDHQEYSCPLCSSTIAMDVPATSVEAIEVVIKQLQTKLKNIEHAIQSNQTELAEKAERLKELLEQQEIYDTVLREFSKKTELPYISELEALNTYIKSFQEKEYVLAEIQRIYKKIEEKEFEILNLNKILDKLREKEKALKVEEKYENDLLEYLNTEYRKSLNEFQFKANPEDSGLDKNNYTPIYADASVFDHESGGLLMCIQIAYIGAILKRKKTDGSINHPGFLMFDTLSKYLGTYKSDEDSNRLDPRSYEAIYSYLIELSENFQIFVVDNTPPEFADNYVKFTFLRAQENEDLKGFIDLSKNELKDLDLDMDNSR
jgi:hypothetical protein